MDKRSDRRLNIEEGSGTGGAVPLPRWQGVFPEKVVPVAVPVLVEFPEVVFLISDCRLFKRILDRRGGIFFFAEFFLKPTKHKCSILFDEQSITAMSFIQALAKGFVVLGIYHSTVR